MTARGNGPPRKTPGNQEATLAPTTPLRVRFTEPQEFLDELKQDRELVEREIVRASKIARPDATRILTNVSVQAGAIVAGRPIVLERYVGALWGERERDEQVHAAASELITQIKTRVEELGLELRPGLTEGGHDA